MNYMIATYKCSNCCAEIKNKYKLGKDTSIVRCYPINYTSWVVGIIKDKGLGEPSIEPFVDHKCLENENILGIAYLSKVQSDYEITEVVDKDLEEANFVKKNERVRTILFIAGIILLILISYYAFFV